MKEKMNVIFKKLYEINESCPFQIAIHCTPTLEKAEGILKEGLRLKPAVSSLDANMFRYGRVAEIDERRKSAFITDNGCGRFAVLTVFPNQIGFQDRDYRGYNQDEMLTEADAVIMGSNKFRDESTFRSILPAELVLSYVDSESGDFVLNPDCLLLKPEEERNAGIQKYVDILNEQRKINKVVGWMMGYEKIKWDPNGLIPPTEEEQGG